MSVDQSPATHFLLLPPYLALLFITEEEWYMEVYSYALQVTQIHEA